MEISSIKANSSCVKSAACITFRFSMICCFKRTGMSIAKLKDFFSLEKDEENSIDDMIELSELQKKTVEDKLKELHADYDHVQKKIRFYKDIKKAMENGLPKPDWEDYK